MKIVQPEGVMLHSEDEDGDAGIGVPFIDVLAGALGISAVFVFIFLSFPQGGGAGQRQAQPASALPRGTSVATGGALVTQSQNLAREAIVLIEVRLPGAAGAVSTLTGGSLKLRWSGLAPTRLDQYAVGNDWVVETVS